MLRFFNFHNYTSPPYQVRINFGQKFPQKNKEHPIQNAPYIFFIKTCQRHLIYNHLCRRRVSRIFAVTKINKKNNFANIKIVRERREKVWEQLNVS